MRISDWSSDVCSSDLSRHEWIHPYIGEAYPEASGLSSFSIWPDYQYRRGRRRRSLSSSSSEEEGAVNGISTLWFIHPRWLLGLLRIRHRPVLQTEPRRQERKCTRLNTSHKFAYRIP